MIVKSIINGFKQVRRNMRIVYIFYLFNLLFGVLLMLPFRAPVSKMIGNTLWGEQLAGRFDFNFLLEFLAYSKDALPAISAFLTTVPIVYLLLSLFLSGGAFSIFVTGETFQPVRFWGDSARYFGRFIRLGLFTIPVFLAFILLPPLLVKGIQRLIWGSDPYQNILYWGGWLKVILRYSGFYLSVMIFDYARIYVVENDESKMLLALKTGFLFVFKNLLRTGGLMLLIIVAGIIVLIIYNLIADVLTLPNALVIIFLFLVQQLYMFFRMLLRVTLYAGEVSLFQNSDAEEILLASGEKA
ncbi:hypothetical protein GF337_07250 [candidate division KSB1 bacterium]|nr:hypothetical protein [candidate division KSB1 bacterium]